jgi:hypothetical protein
VRNRPRRKNNHDNLFLGGSQIHRKETIDDRLTRLNKYWDEVLANTIIGNEEDKIDETTPQQLTQFGLTKKEAKAWFKNEPQYPTDVFSHEPKNRRRLHRTG